MRSASRTLPARPASANPEPRPKRLASPRQEAGHVVSKLSRLYPEPQWAIFPEVRSSAGCPEGLRTADALAVLLGESNGPSRQIQGFEVKLNRPDGLRERKQPGWGLIEVGTGTPSIVVEAAEREAEEPTPGFTRALLRASLRAATLRADPDADAPLQPITRPALSRHHIGLGCGHVARPLAKEKDWPRYVPCRACLAEHPTDLELVLASIEDAGSQDLRRIDAALEGRRPC